MKYYYNKFTFSQNNPQRTKAESPQCTGGSTLCIILTRILSGGLNSSIAFHGVGPYFYLRFCPSHPSQRFIEQEFLIITFSFIRAWTLDFQRSLSPNVSFKISSCYERELFLTGLVKLLKIWIFRWSLITVEVVNLCY